MKKLLFLLALLPIGLLGQTTFKYQVKANGGISIGGSDHSKIDSAKVIGDNVVVWVGGVAYYALPDTAFAPLSGATFTGDISATQVTVTGGTPIAGTLRFDSLQFSSGDTIDLDDVALDLDDYAILLNDTIQLFVFGAGGGQAGDTACFSTSTIYGSFFNESRDSLVITSLRVVMLGDAADTLSVDILWDANLNDATPTELNADPLPVNSITSGDEDTSFAKNTIPPDVWVWCETPGVTAGRKPFYFNAVISGYIKRTE